MRILFAVICLAIIYGSLYPFNFNPNVDFQAALNEFLNTWRFPVSRGDLVGNVSLFVPFGFIGGLWIARKFSVPITLLILGFIFVPLSLGCQIAQFYLPSRDATLVDVGWNLLGAFIGFLLCLIPGVRALFNRRHSGPDATMPILLGLLWVSSLLMPLLPGLDWQEWKQAFKPLLASPELQWKKLLLNTAAWVALAHMLAVSLNRSWRDVWLPILIALTLFLQLAIATRALGISDLLAAAFALMIWFTISLYPAKRAVLAGMILLLAYLTLGLAPSGTAPASGKFALIPFEGFLNGSMMVNATVFCRKLFIYGTLVWLAVDAGMRLGTVVILLGGIVLGVELAQTSIPGRTAELTDVLIVFAMGTALLGHRRTEPIPVVTVEPISSPKNFSVTLQDPTMPLPRVHTQQTRPLLSLIGFIAGIVAITAGIYWASSSQVVSPVLKNLLPDSNSILALILLSLAILTIGFGSGWAAWLTARSKIPWMIAPVAVGIVTITIFVLVKFGLTTDALASITGENSFIQTIKGKSLFATSGADVISRMGESNAEMLAAALEPAIRFSALLGPVIILFTVSLVSLLKSTGLSNKGTARRTASVLKHYLVAFLYMSPWLLLCLVIVNPALLGINVDDVAELFSGHSVIADIIRGFLLIMIITASAALLGWALSSGRIVVTAITVLICAAAIIPTWYILNEGMPSITSTLDLTYPGSNLPSGADEQAQLSGQDLLIQWGTIQLSIAAGLAFGATLFLLLSGRRYESPSARREIPEAFLDEVIVAPTKDAEYSLRDSAPMPTSASLTITLSESQQTFLADLSRHMGTGINQTLTSILTRYCDSAGTIDAKWNSLVKSRLSSGIANNNSSVPVQKTFTLTTTEVESLETLAQAQTSDISTITNVLLDIFIDETRV